MLDSVYNTLLFIAVFVVINCLFFLPNTLVQFFSKRTRNQKKLQPRTISEKIQKLTYRRFGGDFFRINPEISLFLFTVSVFDYQVSKIVLSCFCFFLTCSCFYYLYIWIIIRIYHRQPTLLDDYELSKTGVMLFRKLIPFLLIGILFSFSLVYYLNFSLLEILITQIESIQNKSSIYILLIFSILSGIITIKKFKYKFAHANIHFSTIAHFIVNLWLSQSLRRITKKITFGKISEKIDQIFLEEKPNIFLIFLESYGEIALTHKQKSPKIIQKLKHLGYTLSKGNWHSASTLSTAPIRSGESWLSHSTLLYGKKIAYNSIYDSLFSDKDKAQELQSIVSVLNQNNYLTTLVSTVSHDPGEVSFDKVHNCYKTDSLFLYDDLEYKGQRLPFFGRETIPDEFTLNQSYEKVKNKDSFFIQISTTNSHAEFKTPLKAEKDWQDYQTQPFDVTDGSPKNREYNYFTSILYHFDYLNTFFKKNTFEKDTIFIVLGDHQPPFITPEDASANTPIHIRV